MIKFLESGLVKKITTGATAFTFLVAPLFSGCDSSYSSDSDQRSVPEFLGTTNPKNQAMLGAVFQHWGEGHNPGLTPGQAEAYGLLGKVYSGQAQINATQQGFEQQRQYMEKQKKLEQQRQSSQKNQKSLSISAPNFFNIIDTAYKEGLEIGWYDTKNNPNGSSIDLEKLVQDKVIAPRGLMAIFPKFPAGYREVYFDVVSYDLMLSLPRCNQKANVNDIDKPGVVTGEILSIPGIIESFHPNGPPNGTHKYGLRIFLHESDETPIAQKDFYIDFDKRD